MLDEVEKVFGIYSTPVTAYSKVGESDILRVTANVARQKTESRVSNKLCPATKSVDLMQCSQ